MPGEAVTAFRVANYGTPLRALPGRVDTRFHRATGPLPVSYLCLHPLGPMAEVVRHQELRRFEQVAELRLRVWALRLDLEPLLRITFETAREHRITPRQLIADQPYTACQNLAERLAGDGVPGLVVPSAALPGTENVVLLGPRLANPWQSELLGEVELPAGIAAERGGPPLSLIGHVRHVGRPHAGFEAWRRGREFAFSEPDWSWRR